MSRRSRQPTAARSSNCVGLEAPVVLRPGRSRPPKLHSPNGMRDPRDFADLRNFDATNIANDIARHCAPARLCPSSPPRPSTDKHLDAKLFSAVTHSHLPPPIEGTRSPASPPPPCLSSISPTCAHIYKMHPKRVSDSPLYPSPKCTSR
jgi:hypothetical protein